MFCGALFFLSFFVSSFTSNVFADQDICSHFETLSDDLAFRAFTGLEVKELNQIERNCPLFKENLTRYRAQISDQIRGDLANQKISWEDAFQKATYENLPHLLGELIVSDPKQARQLKEDVNWFHVIRSGSLAVLQKFFDKGILKPYKNLPRKVIGSVTRGFFKAFHGYYDTQDSVVFYSKLLSYAAENGYLDIVQYLYEVLGADPLLHENYEYSALMDAAKGGHLEIMQYLLKFAKADPFEKKAEDGDTLMHIAARGCHLNIVQYLRKNFGMSLSAQNKHGETALDLGLSPRFGKNPCSLDLVQYFHEVGKIDRLHSPCGAVVRQVEAGHNDVVQYLHEQMGVNLSCNYLGESLVTPLHMAAQKGNIELVKYIYEKGGVDPDIRDSYGKSPLHYAVQGGNPEVVEYLLRVARIRPDVQDENGETPIHDAARRCDLTLIRYLYETADEPLSLLDLRGETPLHFAAKGDFEDGCLKVIKYLHKTIGASLVARSNRGITPLNYATWAGYLKIIDYLHKRGADLNETDGEGHTSLCYARRWDGNLNRSGNRKEVVEYLKSKGARPHEGQCPLGYDSFWSVIDLDG